MDPHGHSDHRTPAPAPEVDPHGVDPDARSMHHWLMMLMCVPMAVIALVLVATGVVGAGALLAVIGCVAMMAVMMRMMGSH